MRDEETFALREGHGMAGNGEEVVEGGAGAADEVMLDGKDGFGGDGEGAFEEEVVDAEDGASEGVFYWGEEGVGEAVGDGAEGGVESRAGDGGGGFAEELDGGGFAEGAGLALEGDTQFGVIDSSHTLASFLDTNDIRSGATVSAGMRALSREAALYDEMKTGWLQVGMRATSRVGDGLRGVGRIGCDFAGNGARRTAHTWGDAVYCAEEKRQ